MSSLDDHLQAISGKVKMREVVDSLQDGDQAILLVMRAEDGPHGGKHHAVQINCNTMAAYCYVLGKFLHDEYEGRFH